MHWTEAILEVLQRHGGATTLAHLYAEAPDLVTKTQSRDIEKAVRSAVELLKNGRGKNKIQRIKQIGLATYAFLDYETQQNLFDEIQAGKIQESDFVALPQSTLHGHLQGMLVEIGNMRNFQTYTPDKKVVFNGKSLAEVSSLASVPPFTYVEQVDIIRQIDVIWFQDGYPVRTFDVEHSTNFTSALLRCYQLKYFKTACVMVADKRKENVFQKRLATKPFNEIKDSVALIANEHVFETYKRMVHLHELKSDTLFV